MASILVIDNDPAITELLEASLSKVGYATVSVKNGLEGLKMFNCQTFDLVVTEMFMPEVDGFDVIMNLKMKGSCTKIIAIFKKAVSTDIESRIDLANYSGIRTLKKPFTVDELLSSVSELLKDVV